MIGLRKCRADGVDGRLTVRGRPVVRDEENANLLAPMILREGIAGRNRLQPEEDVELVRRACLKVPVPAHDPGRVLQLPEDRAAIDRARRVRLEKETGDDAKISTAAAQSPEEIGVVRLVRGNKCAVRQNHIGLDQIVDGKPVLAAEIAVAATESQAGDACRRDDAERDGKTEGVGGVVNIACRAASPHPHGPVCRIDAHALHHRQVDDQPVVDAAESGSVVAAAADGDGKLAVAAEVHGSDHVGGIRAARDQQWPLVDHPVVELAGFLVVGVVATDQGATESFAKLSHCLVAHDFLLNVLPGGV